MREARKLGIRALAPVIAALGVAVLTCDAQAQVTSAQQSAIRSACRSDFMAKCSGVTPGGKDALVCLQKNVNGLSPACKTAVAATLPPPAPAAAAKPVEAKPPEAAPPKAVSTPAPTAAPAAPTTPSATAAPAAAVASAPPPKAKVAPPPRAAAKPAGAAIAAPAPAPPATAAPTPVAVTPAAPAARPPKAPIVNAAVMLRACKLDLFRHCRGVTPGGGRELACLAAHEQDLTIRCKTARKVTSPLR